MVMLRFCQKLFMNQSNVHSNDILIINLECAKKWMKKYFDARCVFSVQLHRQILQICICMS